MRAADKLHRLLVQDPGAVYTELPHRLQPVQGYRIRLQALRGHMAGGEHHKL